MYSNCSINSARFGVSERSVSLTFFLNSSLLCITSFWESTLRPIQSLTKVPSLLTSAVKRLSLESVPTRKRAFSPFVKSNCVSILKTFLEESNDDSNSRMKAAQLGTVERSRPTSSTDSLNADDSSKRSPGISTVLFKPAFRSTRAVERVKLPAESYAKISVVRKSLEIPNSFKNIPVSLSRIVTVTRSFSPKSGDTLFINNLMSLSSFKSNPLANFDTLPLIVSTSPAISEECVPLSSLPKVMFASISLLFLSRITSGFDIVVPVSAKSFINRPVLLLYTVPATVTFKPRFASTSFRKALYSSMFVRSYSSAISCT